nr:hypothetical protein [Novosphingobium panipatense]
MTTTVANQGSGPRSIRSMCPPGTATRALAAIVPQLARSRTPGEARIAGSASQSISLPMTASVPDSRITVRNTESLRPSQA